MNVKTFAGLVALVGAAGCYSEVNSPATPVSYGWQTPQSTTVSGPPGGGADPDDSYQSPDQPGYPQGYQDGYPGGYPPGTEYGQEAPESTETPAEGTPYDQPQDTATGAVNDQEIDSTLNGYGEWVQDDDYGRIWRPYATVVGADFTPYESCGSWLYTDYGWTFSCTDWSWGWLPFHYGQWAWFDDFGWGWCPGYEWSPAWVDWRDGGGYVGWRPTQPRIRDHRHHDAGPPDPNVRDHRHHRIANHDSNWRFASVNDLGKSHIRAHTYKNVADGLRMTSVVSAPSAKGPRTASAAQVMQQRARIHERVQGNVFHPQGQGQPTVGPQRQPVRPTVQQPRPTYQPQPTYQRPTYQRPTVQQPRPTYQPQPTYQPPSRPTYQPPSRPTYQPPSRPTYQPPSRPTYQPPTRSTYQPPSRPSYSPPATTHYSGGSHSSGSYSAPSHSSSGGSHSSSSSSSSHSSSSSSSHSSGRHR